MSSGGIEKQHRAVKINLFSKVVFESFSTGGGEEALIIKKDKSSHHLINNDSKQ